MTFAIQKQTQAEQDKYLFESFHDTGVIKELIENNYSIIAGRKGSGKTAIARYLQNKYSSYPIDYSTRLSVSDIGFDNDWEEKSKTEVIIFFIIIRTIQSLLETTLVKEQYKSYWKDFLNQNGIQNITDYRSFEEYTKKNQTCFSFRAIVSGTVEKEYKKYSINSLSTFLFLPLVDSIENEKEIFIFVDDISDYLDHSNKGKPDFVLNNYKTVIFVDSCFWHGCKKHCRVPSVRKKYWTQKIERNKKRDKKVNKYYKKLEWKILRIWEHDIKKIPKRQ